MMNDSIIWWSDFCGNQTVYDAFWSDRLSWNTQIPEFTNCFLETVVSWVAPAFLWVFAPFYVAHLSRRHADEHYKQRSWLNISKVVVTVLLILVVVMSLIRRLSGHLATAPPVAYTTPIAQGLTYLMATVLCALEYRKGISSSGVLWTFWLLDVFFSIVPLYSGIRHFTQQGRQEERFYFFLARFVLVVASFGLASVADHGCPPHREEPSDPTEKSPLLFRTVPTERPAENPSPQRRATFFSYITFAWVTKFLIKGFRNPHQFESLYDLHDSNKSAAIFRDFERHMQRERLAESSMDNVNSRLFRSLAKTVSWNMTVSGINRLLAIILGFINPIILKLLIQYVAARDPYTWKGVFYSLVFLINIGLFPIAIHLWLYHGFVAGMKTRTVLNELVYRKALKLSSAAKRRTTVGEIVNLMSVDAQKIQDSFPMLQDIWATPVMVVASVYFLWLQIGAASLAGMLVLLVLLPFNAIGLGNIIRNMQNKQMVDKDSRIKVIGEVLSGIKVLKFYAWEVSFLKKILGIREMELKSIKVANYANAIGSISWFMAPYLTSLAIFGVYVAISPQNVLNPEVAFVSMSLINILNFPISLLPLAVTYIGQAATSFKRTSKFLTLDEIHQDSSFFDHNVSEENAVEIRSGTFSWGDEEPVLKNINLTVPKGELWAIIGQVGCGKSSLVSAILGEMTCLSGHTRAQESVAYVPQQAWIQNDTVRGNILFGKDYTRIRYEIVKRACALEADLSILPGGDMTEIGEKGINLSGGQKQRVSVARAAYQDLDLYLLDDPLSAVDAHVAKHIFEHVIGPKGLLRDKTRFLVTHNLTVLPECDRIMIMADGRILDIGTYGELLSRQEDFLSSFTGRPNDIVEGYMDSSSDMYSDQGGLTPCPSISSGLATLPRVLSQRRMSRRMSRRRSTLFRTDTEIVQETLKENNKLIDEEFAETEQVRWGVIWEYIRAGGLVAFVLTVACHVVFIGTQVLTNIWLSEWTNDPVVNGTREPQHVTRRLQVYGVLGVAQAISIAIEAVALAQGSIQASRVLHSKILHRILHAPMAFFDTTPLGRIINRFSKDLDFVDSNLPLFIRSWLFGIAPFASTMVVISYSTPIFMAVVLPLIILYVGVQKVYVSNVRQLKRIDSVTRSPIYAHFDESIVGVSSIRAYGREQAFIDKCRRLIDQSQNAWYMYICSQRWLGVWMEIVGAFIVFFASLFAVLQRDTISSGIAGLSISFALNVTLYINITIRNASELESYIVAVERLKEYSEVPIEAPWRAEGASRPAVTWPDAGKIEFYHYGTRYRPGLDLVLKEISCSVKSTEKIGVVGRTGSGKSTMTLSLFRILEATRGRIIIDDVNIADVGLHDLRSKLTIIPQEPVLFSGSLRQNLDPFGIYSDDSLWIALDHAHLRSFVQGQSSGLDYEVGENGEALSIGQRQLVCLARALLRKSKILVLDEATAAVDLETDELIQATIRAQFNECTILTIAHRLQTVLDYDRILVLDNGAILEFDTPRHLLRNKKSAFHSMATDAGLFTEETKHE